MKNYISKEELKNFYVAYDILHKMGLECSTHIISLYGKFVFRDEKYGVSLPHIEDIKNTIGNENVEYEEFPDENTWTLNFLQSITAYTIEICFGASYKVRYYYDARTNEYLFMTQWNPYSFNYVFHDAMVVNGSYQSA